MSLRRIFVDGIYGQMHVRLSEPEFDTDKTPLYCIHQSPSSSLVYVPILKSLGEDRQVAAGDTPGFGESDPPDSIPEIEDYARAHGKAIDLLGFKGPLDLIGYFTGSKIAVALALQKAKQIRKLVLLGIPIYSQEELDIEKSTYQKEQYTWDGAHIIKWWNHLKKNAPENYPIDLFVKHFAEIQRGGPKSWWGHHAAFNYDTSPQLAKLNIPVLVICTEDPQGYKSQRASKFIKKGTFIDVPHKGQGLLDLHTDEISNHLRKFLDSSDNA